MAAPKNPNTAPGRKAMHDKAVKRWEGRVGTVAGGFKITSFSGMHKGVPKGTVECLSCGITAVRNIGQTYHAKPEGCKSCVKTGIKKGA